MSLTPRKFVLSAPLGEVQLRYLDSDVGIGFADDLFVVIWRDETTVEGVARASAEFRSYSASRTRELAMLAIVEPGAKMPDAEARACMARFLDDARDRLLISAVAFEGQGFVAAGIRGVVVGLTMIARQPYPHRVFASVVEAAKWMESEQQRIGKRFSSSRIRVSVERLRDVIAGTWSSAQRALAVSGRGTSA